MNHNLYERWQNTTVEQALQYSRVLILSGPRQCGKTTLTKNLTTQDVIYRTFDDKSYYETAQADPNGFVQNKGKLMIIDEIQRVPDILREIKRVVDENNKPGQYLLTGSANIRNLPNVSESLAGRVHTLRLRPLAIGEIYGSSPCFVENAFSEVFNTNDYENYDRDFYLNMAFKGGYPEVIKAHNSQHSKMWYREYIKALLEQDLREIINIRRKDTMMKLLSYLAAWSSKFLNLSQISASLSVPIATIETYINVLETLYLVERISPWTKTDYERVSKKDKLFITDTGLMASILKWKPEKVLFDSDMSGKLMESFVFSQLSAIIEATPYTYELYHYRDRESREIDFLIENDEGDTLGIEVKVGTSIGRNAFKHLIWFRDTFMTEKKFVGIVLYSGKDVLRFGEGMWAVPMNALWS